MKTVSIILFIFLCGCSSNREIIELDYKPTIPTLPRIPSLPVKDLNNDSRPDQVMKAYAASLMLQKSYILEVNNMIDSLN